MGDAGRVRELVGNEPALLRELRGTNGGLLTLAVNHQQLEMLRLLLDLGADPDERTTLDQVEETTLSWGTPLWYAALVGRRDIAELLLDRGADPNANVYASGWPLRNAYRHKDGVVKQLLLDRGAKPQPYMVAEAHDTAEAKRLLDADRDRRTCQRIGLVRRLSWMSVDRGAGDPAAQLASWRSPLALDLDPTHSRRGSRRARSRRILRMLADSSAARGLESGSADGRDDPAFCSRAPRHYADGTRALCRHAAGSWRRDGSAGRLLQSTPLGWACRWGHKPMVELLIARGAPILSRTQNPGPSRWRGRPRWGTPILWRCSKPLAKRSVKSCETFSERARLADETKAPAPPGGAGSACYEWYRTATVRESLPCHVFTDSRCTCAIVPDALSWSLFQTQSMRAILYFAVLPALWAQVDVLTANYDNNRTNANLGEFVLNKANVNPTQFGKLYTLAVDGDVYAQPLYKRGVDVAGGARNILFVASMNNSVYAFDADATSSTAAIWKRNLGVAVDPNLFSQIGFNYTDILAQIGILSTPVIDPSTNTLYVVNFTLTDSGNGNVYAYYLHALDLTTGAEKFNGPVHIQATLPGTGWGGLDKSSIISFR